MTMKLSDAQGYYRPDVELSRQNSGMEIKLFVSKVLCLSSLNDNYILVYTNLYRDYRNPDSEGDGSDEDYNPALDNSLDAKRRTVIGGKGGRKPGLI